MPSSIRESRLYTTIKLVREAIGATTSVTP